MRLAKSQLAFSLLLFVASVFCKVALFSDDWIMDTGDQRKYGLFLKKVPGGSKELKDMSGPFPNATTGCQATAAILALIVSLAVVIGRCKGSRSTNLAIEYAIIPVLVCCPLLETGVITAFLTAYGNDPNLRFGYGLYCACVSVAFFYILICYCVGKVAYDALRISSGKPTISTLKTHDVAQPL